MDPKREAQEARVDRAVAEDVAVGMAAKATVEEARANAYATRAVVEEARADNLATHNVVQGAQLDQTRAQRDAEAVSGAIARQDARSASFGFWLLLGLVAVSLLIGAIWAANRPEPADRTVVVNRPPATAPPARNPTAPVTVVTPAPPPPAPPTPAPPVVVEREVPVPVPVPAPPAQRPNTTVIVQPEGSAPATSTDDAPATETTPAPEGTGETGTATDGG